MMTLDFKSLYKPLIIKNIGSNVHTPQEFLLSMPRGAPPSEYVWSWQRRGAYYKPPPWAESSNAAVLVDFNRLLNIVLSEDTQVLRS